MSELPKISKLMPLLERATDANGSGLPLLSRMVPGHHAAWQNYVQGHGLVHVNNIDAFLVMPVSWSWVLIVKVPQRKTDNAVVAVGIAWRDESFHIIE